MARYLNLHTHWFPSHLMYFRTHTFSVSIHPLRSSLFRVTVAVDDALPVRMQTRPVTSVNSTGEEENGCREIRHKGRAHRGRKSSGHASCFAEAKSILAKSILAQGLTGGRASLGLWQRGSRSLPTRVSLSKKRQTDGRTTFLGL